MTGEAWTTDDQGRPVRTTCRWDGLYQGPPLSDLQLAEIFVRPFRRGRKLSDPELHREMGDGFSGGARPESADHPCLLWSNERDGIHYELGHDGVKRILKWSTIAQLDDTQLDLFEGIES